MSFTVAEVISFSGGRLVNASALGSKISQIKVKRPAPLSATKPDDLGFFFSRQYEAELLAASPGILITGEPFVGPLQASGLPLWENTAVIACQDPYLVMAKLSEKFAEKLSTIAYVERANGQAQTDEAQIHPSAAIAQSAKIGEGARIGAHCTIEENAVIGSGSVLYPGCYIGPEVKLGTNCILFPGVTLYEWTEIGSRVRIHAGAVLGSDGFGYAPIKSGGKTSGHQKIYHLGRVIVGDDVEIGANTCVDRSTFGETRISSQSKLDNQVHIGHNATLEEGAIICGGTCLAGNASVGRYAYVGGLTGIGNHVHVGDGASVGAVSMITKDVEPGGTAVGNPQREMKEHFRVHALLSRMLSERKNKAKEPGNG